MGFPRENPEEAQNLLAPSPQVGLWGPLPPASESNPSGPEPVDSRTPSRILAEEEGLRRLLAKLNSLPDNYRQAILLMKVEGLSTQEAAGRLGKSHEATALLLHRALKRFRALEDTPGDGSHAAKS